MRKNYCDTVSEPGVYPGLIKILKRSVIDSRVESWHSGLKLYLQLPLVSRVED